MKPQKIFLSAGIIVASFLLSSSKISNSLLGINNDDIAIKAIFIDENNHKWFGTSHGLFKFDGLTWTRYSTANHLISDSVNSLTFELSAYGPELWVATNKGVSVLAYDVDGVTSATSYNTESGVLGTNVADVAVDSKHNKIFGSDEGLTYFYSGTMDHYTYEDYKTSLIDAPVNDMDIHNDSIYIGFDGGIGRMVADEVDAITGASRWTSEYGITPLSGNIICVEIDTAGNQWFGTDAGAEKHVGLKAKENWMLYTEEDGLVNNMVVVIRQDKEGGMWFGTYGGVSHLMDDTWQNYTTSDGLASDTVYDIAFEEDGTVWFATHNGISKLSEGEITGLEIILGINQPSGTLTDVKVYQNESSALVIDFQKGMNGPVQVMVYDVNGKLVVSNNTEMAGTEKLTMQIGKAFYSGIYFIKVVNDHKIIFSEKVLLK